jgi:hypothetical protein
LHDRSLELMELIEHVVSPLGGESYQ